LTLKRIFGLLNVAISTADVTVSNDRFVRSDKRGVGRDLKVCSLFEATIATVALKN
jgi:hypothetical protein